MKRSLALVACVLLAASAAGPASAAKDRRRPRVAYATQDQAILITNPANVSSDEVPIEVLGTARDDLRIKRVDAVWVPCTTSTAESCSFVGVDLPVHDGGPVSMTCDAKRRSCVWRAPAPAGPGSYWFAAVATDASGKESRGSGILRVTVL